MVSKSQQSWRNLLNNDEESQEESQKLQFWALNLKNSSNLRILAKGTGNYLFKVKLVKNIPSIVPMFGFKIMVYYNGIKKNLILKITSKDFC
jgi:hypothetical protein